MNCTIALNVDWIHRSVNRGAILLNGTAMISFPCISRNF